MDKPLTVAVRVRRHSRGPRIATCVLALLLAAPLTVATGADKPVDAIITQIDAGHFHAAEAAIGDALAQPGLCREIGRASCRERV